MTEPKNHRIHLVVTPAGKRLVRAATKNAAIRHVARGMIECSVASQDELVACLGAGITVEVAAAVEADETQS